ncbi:hypothetical protein AWENTII_006558 [Aspergillus wentii]|nr:hypothetical protein MW887_006334 [Aspergillus wentii]
MGKTVLLVLDVQNGVIQLLKNMDTYLDRLAPIIETARDKSIKIIYVTTAFRPDYPDLHPRNPSAPRVMPSKMFLEGDASVEIHPSVTPVQGDVIITKRRVSSFTGTELDLVLRSLGAEHLVLAGLSTSGAVLSTVRQGADLDYSLTVLEDLCRDRDYELHDVLMKKVIARQAQVVSSAQWVAGFGDEE